MGKYPEADLSKITASKDEFGRTVVNLLSKEGGAKYPLEDDGTIGKSKKGSKPGKQILNALGDTSELVLEANNEFMKSQEEIHRKALEKNKDYDEAQQEKVFLQRRLDLAIKELADVRRTAAEGEAHYRKVIERNTQLEIDLRNADEDQRTELTRQLAKERAEIERLQGDRDGAVQRRTTAEKQVEGLRRTIERLERHIENLRRNVPERAGELQRVRGEFERLEAENERLR